MPVWYISRRDGKDINGFVCGLGGAGVAKRSFRTAEAAERGMSLISSRDPNGAANDEYMLEEVRGLADHLKLDEHCPALVSGIKAEPMEETRQRVLADRLCELGIEYNRAYREARQIALNSMNPCLWPSADLEKLLKGTGGAARIRRLLDLANEGRKTRTVKMSQAMEICLAARKAQWHMAVGAGSRRRGGSSTVFFAACHGGKMRVAIGVVPSDSGAAVAMTQLGLRPLGIEADRREWVNRDEVQTWSVGVGSQHVLRLC